MIIEELLGKASSLFNSVLVSFYIIFLGLLFASIFEKFTRFILKELRVNSILKKGLNFTFNIEKLISKTVYYIFFFTTIILSLNNLGATWYVIIGWSLFIIIVFSLSFILDVKDGIINTYYGFKLKNKIHKGDIITTEVIKGKVIKKSFLGITVHDSHDEHYIPNVFLSTGYVLKSKFKDNTDFF